MSESNIPEKSKLKSQLMKLVLPVIAGCLLTCCLNVLLNQFYYGKKVVKLNKNLGDYVKDDYIPHSDVVNINMSQTLKWSIIPAIFNLIIWAGIIWFITQPATKKVDNTSTDEI